MKNYFKTINYANLEYNLNYFKNLISKHTRLCAVVKNDAYGHNSIKVCEYLQNKVDYFAFSNNFEAIKVLNKVANIQCLIIGPFSTQHLKLAIKKDICISVENLEQLKLLNTCAQKLNKVANYQLKINTGMNRLGITTIEDFKNFILESKKYKNCKIVGFFSHLGSGKRKVCKRTNAQITTFRQFIEVSPPNLIAHLCNSVNTLNSRNCFDMVRIGIGLYGYGNHNLKPIMSIYAKVVAIHDIKKGEFLGYGNKHKAPYDIKIAIINIGYGQGLPRYWAKQGFMLVNNKKAKIVADICMDMTFVDITKCGKVNIGDFATVLGTQKSLNANTIAKAGNTIPYEILTNFKNIPFK